MNTSMLGIGMGPGIGTTMPGFVQALWPYIVAWSIFWAALALWHAAQRGHKWWFLIFIVVHTLGILEIVYLFGIIKLKGSDLFTSKV